MRTENDFVAGAYAGSAHGEMQAVGCIAHAEGTPRADEFGKVLLEIREIFLENKCATAADIGYHLKKFGFARAEQKTIIEERNVAWVQFKSSGCFALRATA
jgi:hypothetical protein